MAFIPYIAPEDLPPDFRLPDSDNILRIHGVHPAIGLGVELEDRFG